MAPLLDVRPQDRRNTAVAFFVLFGLMTGHALLETARDALFLASLPAEHLPWCYLGIAVLAVIAAAINRYCADALPRRTLLAVTLLVVAVVTAALWIGLAMQGPAVAYVTYIWTGLVATIVVVQFWLVLGDLFTVSQAKRVYALIGAGALLGATVGSALAGALLLAIDPRDLLLAAAVVFFLGAFLPIFFQSSTTHVRGRGVDSMGRGGGSMALLQRHPYLRRLLALVVLGTITVTFVDYTFKSTVAANVPAGELGTFFAQFYVGLNGIALVVQLLFASWLVRGVGVNRSLLAMPILVLGGTLAFLLGPALVTALVLKGTDGALRHSVNRTATELLYVPLSSDIRHRIKAFIDALGQRGGQALASVAILGALAIGATPAQLAVVIAATAVLWTATILGIEDHYLELFRQQLRAGTIDARSELPGLDLHSLETLMSTLNSADDSEVVSALEMLAEQRRTNLIPALILYHPSTDVVLRALDILADSGRTDFVGVCDRLLDGGDSEVRAAALRARTRVSADEKILRQHLDNDCGHCRITAMVGLIATGFARANDELERSIAAIIEGDSPEEKLALARAIRFQPHSELDWALIVLAGDEDPRVKSEVARGMAVTASPRFLPALLPMLAFRLVRADAREAILAIGSPALEALAAALAAPDTDVHVRRHLPRTISRFHSEQAAAVLTSQLAGERDGMTRFKILRGLRRMQLDNPRLALDRGALRDMAHRTLKRSIELLSWAAAMESDFERAPAMRTRGAELLLSLVREKHQNALERLFRLLGLLDPREDFLLIYSGLRSDDPKTRSSSMELVEHLVEPTLRDAVRALTDNMSDARKLASAADYHSPKALDYAGRLQLLLTDPSEALRSIAAYHIGELRMHELRPDLIASDAGRHRFFREVIDRALHMLDTVEAKHAG